MNRAILILLTPLLLATACKSSRTIGTRDDGVNVFVLRTFHDALSAKIAGNYDEAITLFERVVRSDADNHAAMFELATLFLDKGLLTEADYYASNASKLDSGNMWYQIVYGEVLSLQGRFSEAADVFRKVISDHPTAIEHYMDLAFVLEKGSMFNEAIEALNELEEVVGIQEEITDHKTRLYVQLDNLDGAVNEIENLIANDPANLRYYLKLAQLYEVNMRTEDAHNVYKRILEADPNDGLALMSVADYYKRQGQHVLFLENIERAFRNRKFTIDAKVAYLLEYVPRMTLSDSVASEAIQLGSWLVEGHPEDPKSFALLGDLLYQVDSFDAALNNYYRSLKFDESTFTVWQQVLFINSDLQRFDTLSYWSEQVIDRYPNNALGYFFKGTAESRLNKYEEAIRWLDEGLLIGSGNPLMAADIYSGLGDAYHELEQHAASDSCYEESLKINPNNAYVLNNYSYYLSLRDENLDRAAQMAQQANQIMPGNSAFEDTYGWVLYMQGRYKEAKTWIEKSLMNGGNERAEILEHFGDVLFQLGELNAAVEYWQKANSIAPSDQLGRKIADRKL